MARRFARLLPFLVACTACAPAFANGRPQLGFYLDRKPTVDEVKSCYTGAKYEPLYGCYLGAYIDLDSSLTQTYKDSIGRTRRLPQAFESIVGTPHATYFFYLGYGRPLPTDWVSLLAMQGKIVHIALEPNRGIQYVLDDEYLENLAKDMGKTNAKIFLRFGSEMNGAWVDYGKDPELYKQKFRLVAQKMKQYAPNVAMVWCPYATPINPISSYYPGDDYVDWVGVNMYSVTYYDQDPKKPARQVHPMEMLDYVYDRYSERKPIMIGEYGTTHFSALESKSIPGFAERNLYALYAGLPRRYPRVKCIDYFNGNNLELAHRLNNNYAVTQNAAVLDAYRKVIEPDYYLKDASELPEYFDLTALNYGRVDGSTNPMATVPLSPMPFVDGQTVQGKLDISAWFRTISTHVMMRFKIDGNLLYEGLGSDKWFVTIGTSRLTEGWHTFSVEAFDGRRRVGRRSARVMVLH
ncbi:MAG TPA: glycosyl hydrolase [Fimbriimonadaceae bacterium]|nr:glycosyl hydrolase [Fimbriimonadaceae bacterium]